MSAMCPGKALKTEHLACMYLAHHEPESVNNIVDTVTTNIRQALLQQAAHGHQGLPPYNIAMRLLVLSLTVNARSVWVLSIA